MEELKDSRSPPPVRVIVRREQPSPAQAAAWAALWRRLMEVDEVSDSLTMGIVTVKSIKGKKAIEESKKKCRKGHKERNDKSR